MFAFLEKYLWWSSILTFILTILGLSGCVIELHGNGEVGFKQSTTWSFYHATEILDEKQQATSEISSQPLLDYLAKEEPVGPPAPVTTP